MKNKNNWKFIIIIVVVIAIFALMAFSQPKMILFYGDTCPHCEVVEEFIAENNIKEKIQFKELEVYNNKANAQLLYKKATSCGLDVEQGVGVPFFFDGKNCLLGNKDIIDFLSK